MPKTAGPKTPGAVLQSFIDEYQINAFSLSKSIQVAYQSVVNIIKGKARITVPMALRLSAYFGNQPQYWLDIQSAAEIDELTRDNKFISSIKKIPKAKIGTSKVKKEPKEKIGRKKANTLAEKRKKAEKIPGAKKPKGKRGRPAQK